MTQNTTQSKKSLSYPEQSVFVSSTPTSMIFWSSLVDLKSAKELLGQLSKAAQAAPWQVSKAAPGNFAPGFGAPLEVSGRPWNLFFACNRFWARNLSLQKLT